jgi:hypothetical protein
MPEMEHCAEGARTDALKRACKDIGLFDQMFNSKWIREFKNRFKSGKLKGHYKKSKKEDPGTEQTKGEPDNQEQQEQEEFTLEKLLNYVNKETNGYYRHKKHLLNALALCHDMEADEFALPKSDEMTEWRDLFKRARDYALERSEQKSQEEQKKAA